MAQIFDRSENWYLEIFPELPPSEIIDEPTKGYRAELALDPATNQHVVSNVLYSKKKYTINDVMQKVTELRECERCDTLDKEKLQLESINIPSPAIPAYGAVVSPSSPSPQATSISNTVSVPATSPLLRKDSTDIKNMFGSIIMDTYLTNPGKYFLGLMLDDETLMQSAYPAQAQDMGQFMGDMISFMSGEMDFMRSPEEAREFLSVMQTKDAEGKPIPIKAGKKRLPSSTDAIVIY